MKENFLVTIESMHCSGDDYALNNVSSTAVPSMSVWTNRSYLRGFIDQALHLSDSKLQLREVVHIDIANDRISTSDYREDEDPSKFKSQKTKRGPLNAQWTKTCKPVMSCYKVVTAEFKWFGLQSRVESYILNSERRIFTIFHRKIFCWIDQWYGLSLEDVHKLEKRIKEELDQVMQELITFS